MRLASASSSISVALGPEPPPPGRARRGAGWDHYFFWQAQFGPQVHASPQAHPVFFVWLWFAWHPHVHAAPGQALQEQEFELVGIV